MNATSTVLHRRTGRVLGLRPALLLCFALLVSCSLGDTRRVSLGPIDGRELPPADTGRVQVGDPAPDFSLESYDDGIVTLSDFRGTKEVILVFYRGYW